MAEVMKVVDVDLKKYLNQTHRSYTYRQLASSVLLDGQTRDWSHGFIFSSRLTAFKTSILLLIRPKELLFRSSFPSTHQNFGKSRHSINSRE